MNQIFCLLASLALPRASFRPSLYLRFVRTVGAAVAMMLATLPLYAQIWWTGAGGDSTWSNPDNWSGGVVPTKDDTVWLGYSAEGTVANTAQNIVVDAVSDVFNIVVYGEGNRHVTLSHSDEGVLQIYSSSAVAGNRAIDVFSSAGRDVLIDTPITLWRGAYVVNQSASADLVFLQNMGKTPGSTNSTRIAFRPSGNTIRFGNGLTSVNEFYSAQLNAGRFVIDVGGAKLYAFGFATGKSYLDLIGNLTVDGRPAGNANGVLEISRVGPGDRIIAIGVRSEPSGPGEQILGASTAEWRIMPGGEDQGHLYFQLGSLGAESGWINTSADSTVVFVGAIGPRSHILWADNPGIAGEGNVLFSRGNASGSAFDIQRAMTYTGRTMIERGLIRLSSHTVGTDEDAVTYYGNLPSTTVLEIGTSGTFNLNGIDQTLRGLSNYQGTGGVVQLNSEATLTLEMEDTHSTFGGSLTGTGSLVVSSSTGEGQQTLTGTNTFSGGTTIESGTLQLGDGTAGNDGTLAGNIVNDSILIFNRFGTTTFNGDISGTGTVVMTGTGRQVLSGNNTYTGETQLLGGTLVLDYSTNDSSKLSGSQPLVFGGGELELSGGTHRETPSSVTIAAGASSVTRSSGSAVLVAGNIDRSSGATVDFGADNIVETINTNTNGILGGYATVGGTTWAVSNSNGVLPGAISGLTFYENEYDFALATDNFDAVSSGTFQFFSSLNSLRFNTGDAVTVTLKDNFLISSGGILVTGAVGNNVSTIAGGSSLTSGGADLIIHQHNIDAPLRIETVITGDIGFTHSGLGTTILTATNAYTGMTIVNEGTLQLGDGSSGNDGTIVGDVFLGRTAMLELNRFGGDIFSGNISGDGGVGITTGDVQTLAGENNYSGATVIRTGTLRAGSETALSQNSIVYFQDPVSSVLDLNGFDATVSGIHSIDPLAGIVDLGDATLTVRSSRESSLSFQGTIGGSGRLVVSGEGSLTLAGNNSYSGGTAIGGVLAVAHNSALGSGVAELANDGYLVVQSGISVQVPVVYTALNRSATLVRNLSALETLSTGVSGGFTSSFEGREAFSTTASILDGVASEAMSIEMTFDRVPSGFALNDDRRISDVFSISGTGDTIFVLQLSVDSLSSESFLVWFDLSKGMWVNAIDGNSSVGENAIFGFGGSYWASGASATEDYLGSWGFDSDTGAVWAILDHNSDFAVIPEPGMLGLVLVAALAVLVIRRRK